ncbi:MAG TPA: hypothetical protein VEG34_07250 [Thermoanaerobaculia bacterium]|nr:hypothetical protein [Thermoanaerobaculia bacterium]
MSEPLPPPPAPPRFRAVLWLASIAWVLPLWLIRYLPMVDYPQQLAVASILRYYNDPARALQQAYEPALLRPQGLFEVLAAGLAWLMPIEHAGKVVLALSLALVVPAAVALCRRAGRPDWYALFALAVTYNHAFYWGFTDNLLAYPVVLAGGALADRLFDRPRFGWREWLPLAACGLLFYGIHLQFLLVLAGLVGWLAIARRPGWKRLALWLSTLVPGLAVGMGILSWVHLHSAELMTDYQERIQSTQPYYFSFLEKVGKIPEDCFGFAGGAQYLLTTLLMLAVLALAVPFARPDSRPPARSDGGPEDFLYRSRFLVPPLGLFVLYFVLPDFASGYFVAQRLLALGLMLAVPALPVPPSAVRKRVAALLLGGLLIVQAGQTSASFVRFGAETAGLEELLASTEPGQSMAGLIFSKLASEYDWPPVLTQFPAYYQVEKGGRIHFSFVQFFNSPVRYRPGQNWEDGLLVEWDEWSPNKFSYPRHGKYFRYFLLRGDPEKVSAAFGPYLAGVRVRSAGRWFLIERLPDAKPKRP